MRARRSPNRKTLPIIPLKTATLNPVSTSGIVILVEFKVSFLRRYSFRIALSLVMAAYLASS